MADDKEDKRVQKAALDAFAAAYPTMKVAPEYEAVNDGVYTCRFLNDESKLATAETGLVGFKVVWEITEGDFEGRKLYQDLWLQSAKSGSTKALEITKRELLKLNLDPRDLANPPAIDGLFKVTVETKKGGMQVSFEPLIQSVK